MNIEKSQILIKKVLEKRITPILWGKHGIGKSEIVRQIAKALAEKNKLIFTDQAKEFDEKHFGFVDLRLGQMEIGDLLGMPIPDKDKEITTWLKPLWFPTNPKSRGVIFLDELNRARLDVLQAVFQLVWDRKLAIHILPAGWGIVVACNPSGSDYFVNELDQALMDRFVHIKLTPEPKEWVVWAKNSGAIKSEITDFIEKYPEMLGHDGCEVPIDVKPSPRSWQILSLILADLPEDLWLETAMGIIGNECAITFVESLKRDLEKPVRASQILNHFSKWKTTLAKYGDSKKSRIDLLRISCDDIERILKKDFIEDDLSESQEKNLVEFLRALPSDLSFALIKTIVDDRRMGTDKFNQILVNYDDLYMKLKQVSTIGE